MRKSKRYRKLGGLLRAARKSQKLTQADVANRLGQPQSFVSKCERGEKKLDVVRFLDVTTAIGVDPKTIIDQLAD
jgi:transcriptional regulator with XRE-family HTH domain